MRGRGRGAGQRTGRYVRVRRRPQISSVAEEFEDVWIEDDDQQMLQQIGEEQQDQAVDPAVAAVNILARGEVSGGRIDHVTC